jgi:phosphatidylglycerophosphatase A
MSKKQKTQNSIRPTVRILFSHPAHFISLGFGSGLSPIMPGTAGTLMGWFIFYVVFGALPNVLDRAILGVIVVLGFFFGIWACTKTEVRLNSPDDSGIVWDEIIGVWLVFLGASFFAPLTLAAQCLAFVLFRVFDIIKPPPIRQIDAHLEGGLGVMLDDILAAVFALVVFVMIALSMPYFGLAF